MPSDFLLHEGSSTASSYTCGSLRTYYICGGPRASCILIGVLVSWGLGLSALILTPSAGLTAQGLDKLLFKKCWLRSKSWQKLWLDRRTGPLRIGSTIKWINFDLWQDGGDHGDMLKNSETVSYAKELLDLPYQLKHEQVTCIEAVLKKKDVKGILPTGYGKSLICTLLPYACDYFLGLGNSCDQEDPNARSGVQNKYMWSTGSIQWWSQWCRWDR